MRNVLKCSAAVLLLSLTLFAQTTKTAAPPAPQAAVTAGGPSTELLDAYFKRMFGYDQSLQVKVLHVDPSAIPGVYEVTALFVTPEGQQASHWYVAQDQKNVIAGDILPFGADPFAPARAELAAKAFGPTVGPADAKMQIVEFADLECPACREAQSIMEKLRKDFPQVRFIFQSMPLGKLHPWAETAASYLDCIARSSNEQAFTFIEAVYTHQKEIETAVRKTDVSGDTAISNAAVTERMRHYTEMAGASPDKIQACAESPTTAERITRSEALGKSLLVTGTPTLFINGRRVGNPSGAQYEGLKAVTEFELEQAGANK